MRKAFDRHWRKLQNERISIDVFETIFFTFDFFFGQRNGEISIQRIDHFDRRKQIVARRCAQFTRANELKETIRNSSKVVFRSNLMQFVQRIERLFDQSVANEDQRLRNDIAKRSRQFDVNDVRTEFDVETFVEMDRRIVENFHICAKRRAIFFDKPKRRYDLLLPSGFGNFS